MSLCAKCGKVDGTKACVGCKKSAALYCETCHPIHVKESPSCAAAYSLGAYAANTPGQSGLLGYIQRRRENEK